jgi:hypothetical protein
MSPAVDLDALATALRGQAKAHGQFVLDGTTIAPAVASAIAAAFGLAKGSWLTVTGVTESDVHDASGEQLTLSAGSAAVLNATATPIGLTFTAAGDVTVAATMPAGWTFTTSFPGLAQFPFDDLTPQDATFVYATSEQPKFAWPGEPNTTIDLAAGLNLMTDVALGGFPLITELVGKLIGQTRFKLYGPFGPAAGQSLPVGALTAPLGTGAFSIGSGSTTLSLSAPAVVVQIGAADDDTNPIQPLDLLLQGTFQDVLTVAVEVPVSGTAYAVSTTPLPGKGSVTNLIEALPGGQDFTTYIPSELSSVFSEVGLDNFTIAVDTTPAVTFLGLAISTVSPWTVIDEVLILEGMSLVIEVVDPAGLNWTRVLIDAQARFLPKTQIFTGDFAFEVELDRQTSWEIGSVSGIYEGAINLGELVSGLLGSHDSVPEILRDFEFSNFGVTAARSGQGSPFTYVCFGAADVALPLMATELTAHLDVSFTATAGSYEVMLSGSIAVGEHVFTIELDLGSSGSLLQATWVDSGTPLGFGDIAAGLGWDGMPALPGDLDLALTHAGFSYDFDAGALVLTATSQHYGQLAFASQTVGSSRAYLFDLEVPLGVRLSELPVAGPQIPPSVDVGVQTLEVAYASAPFDAGMVTALDTTLKALGGQSLGFATLDAGLQFVTTLQLGTETTPLTLQLSGADTTSPTPETASIAAASTTPTLPSTTTATAAAGAPSTNTPAPTQASGKWFDIGKTFGPLQLARVGLEYQDGALIFALDANIAFGPLALSLQGLGVGSPIDAFSPVFTLSGLGISYHEPPLLIAGAAQRVPDSQLAKGVLRQFDGMLVVKAEDLSLAAIGSYAEMATGLPSLFVFAQLEAPLGGPPPFFVTGLLGGFGFNRTLAIPGQDEVASFPLLALASQSKAQDPMQVLAALEGEQPLNGVTKAWITPQSGEYWLAAGLEFTSFELVSTKAMLVAEFGDQLTFALLGLSTMQLPTPAASSETYAYVELMLRVVLLPDDGSFAATAILTKNSYVITPDCHLTGGFAFYVWWGENPNAGQFVVTLGGYHPAFKVPAAFPVVPRLGFNWAVSDDVTIKGEAYFALTGSCVMAGGGLEVLFHSGDLQAWFTAHADLLISWHPFSFLADISISIGVSYRLNLLVCHKTITVSLGADLTLWGPPTGGVVDIDLTVVSFSVAFGSSGAEELTDPLAWKDFTALLPEPNTVCRIAITDGLFKSQDAPANSSGKLWIVRAKQFTFQTRSAIPASELTSGATVIPSTTSPGGIAIRPMNLTDVTSTHTLQVFQGTSTTPVDTSTWSVTALPQTVPASLWSAPPVPFSQTPAQPSADVLAGELTGLTVTAPLPNPGSTRGPVAEETLMEEFLTPAGESPLSGGVQATADYVPTADATTVRDIAQVMSTVAQQSRAELISALGAVFDGTDGDLSLLASGAEHLFSDPPLVQT